MLFRETTNRLQDQLRQLSRDGYIYLGRTGAGLTHAFRKECDRAGTIAAIETNAKYHALQDRFLLELLAVEGPRWVGYDRLSEVSKEELEVKVCRKESR